MGIWDDLTGTTAANASKAAAADTYGKQQGAIQKLLGYGDEAKAGYDQIGNSYQPYVNQANNISGASNGALTNLINDPSSVRSLPGYQFNLSQGTQAIDRSAAARGMDQSGRTLKDLSRFGTGLADQTYGNQLQRLIGVNQQGFSQGMQAQGAQNSAFGTGLQAQLGTRTAAYGGDMASAGTIGQGDVAAANAQSAGAQNLLNGGLKLAGMGMGSLGFGGAFGQGGAFGSSLGSSYATQPLSGADGALNKMMFPGYGR